MSADSGESDRGDRAWLERARYGDGAAFEALYQRHRRVVLAFLARRVAEPEVAADLLAETFAALLVVIGNRDRALPESPIAWLIGTARNLLVNSRRRGRVEVAARRRLGMERLTLDDADLRRVEEVSAETDVLAELKAMLPADQFQALKARVFDEEDYATIAHDLGCSEAVVRQRVSRAAKTVRHDRLEAQRNA
jgi:RNA polymerase sigma factor (sigma-70 family)